MTETRPVETRWGGEPEKFPRQLPGPNTTYGVWGRMCACVCVYVCQCYCRRRYSRPWPLYIYILVTFLLRSAGVCPAAWSVISSRCAIYICYPYAVLVVYTRVARLDFPSDWVGALIISQYFERYTNYLAIGTWMYSKFNTISQYFNLFIYSLPYISRLYSIIVLDDYNNDT